MFQLIILIPILIAIVAGVSFVLFNVYRTWQTQTSELQKIWLTGKFPTAALDGFYAGTTDIKTSWMGKKFLASENSGVNVFKKDGEETEKYSFKTYAEKGLWESGLDVLRIDYSDNGNPFWVSAIVDELVEVEPGKYLGKIHAVLVPGLSFVLGFFWLKK